MLRLIHRHSTQFSLSHSIEPLIQPYLTFRKQQHQHYVSTPQKKLPGHYTSSGLQKFSQRHPEILTKSLISVAGLKITNIGIGTYKGSLGEEDDLPQFNGIVDSVLSGVGVIDSCGNFRGGRSETVVGRALRFLIEQKKYEREQFFIGSKGGYVREKVSDDLAEEVVNEHCVHPKFLESSLNGSLERLGLETLDVYYLNNFAESQMEMLGKQKFYEKLAKAFEFCQKARQQKKIKYYGLASWQSFRLAPTQPLYLSLSQVVKTAQKVAGTGHGFKFLQIPINIMMPQAFAQKNQSQSSLLQGAQHHKISILSSSPFLSGSLINIPLPSDKLNCRNNGAKHLQLVRSIPSPTLACTLVGQKTNRHVKKNLEVLKAPVLGEKEWFEIFVPQQEPASVQV